jgi:hypothetical protein
MQEPKERTLLARPQIDIQCQFGLGATAPLALLVDKEALLVDDEGCQHLTVEIVPPIDRAPEPQVRLAFVHTEGQGYRMFAWTLHSGGAFEAWDKQKSACCHRLLGASDQPFSILLTILKVEDPAPNGPPEPGTGSALVKVTVRKKGGMPVIVEGP